MQEFSSSWDIRATPTFFFLRDGQQIDKLVGANKPELQKKIVTFSESIARAKWLFCQYFSSSIVRLVRAISENREVGVAWVEVEFVL